MALFRIQERLRNCTDGRLYKKEGGTRKFLAKEKRIDSGQVTPPEGKTRGLTGRRPHLTGWAVTDDLTCAAPEHA